MRRLSLSAVLALSIALACQSRPGAPLPDAEAIVLGTAGPGVRTDTTDAAFTVSIDRASWRAKESPIQNRDFWSDVAVLDVANAERSARTVDERTFAVALRTLLAGEPEEAAIAFGLLRGNATDPALRARARVGLTMALSWNSDWQAIAQLASLEDSAAEMGTNPRHLQAGVERWARAFANLPPATVSVPDHAVTLPLRRSVFGTPVIRVKINGREHEFWLDTGASMTLLSTDVAIATGVKLASMDTLALGVVSGHIDARAILIDSVEIGPLMARGLTAAVVSPNVLRLDRRVENGVSRPVPIDGVIGTDLLRHMDITIDAGAGTITIRRPRPEKRAVRNLFWVGFPVIRLVTRDGVPVVFGLDTGAEGTYVTPSLLKKLPRTSIAARRGTLNGLGEEHQLTEFVAREVALSDGGHAIALRNIPVAPEHRWTFVTFDGMIGSDVALASRFHLDFVNGIFDVRPSEAAPKEGITVKQLP
jgi:clan AA aspartic protease (TIGR02281 family)